MRTPLEIEVAKLMLQKHVYLSRETAISPAGLCELWRCISIIEGDSKALEAPPASDILRAAEAGYDRAKAVVRLQTELLASMASDFALMTGTRGRVYLCGSYIDALGPLIEPETFATRFYDKGRASDFLTEVPVYRVVVNDPELLGLSTLF